MLARIRSGALRGIDALVVESVAVRAVCPVPTVIARTSPVASRVTLIGARPLMVTDATRPRLSTVSVRDVPSSRYVRVYCWREDLHQSPDSTF